MEKCREMVDMDVLLQQLQQSEQQAREGDQEVRNSQQGHARPPHKKCPRCGSMDTKFCYFNNYSLSQPRYVCKTCKRYWTQGGSLRDIPVGGSVRKSRRSHKRTSSSVDTLIHESSTPTAVCSPGSSSRNLGKEKRDNTAAPAIQSVNQLHIGGGFDSALFQGYNLPPFCLPQQQQQVLLSQTSLMSGLVNSNNHLCPTEQSGISTTKPFTTRYLQQSFNNGGDGFSPLAVLRRVSDNNNANSVAPSEPNFWSDFPNF